MSQSISVIIPSYNSAGTIGAVLEAIQRQTRADLLREVIVVDSSDDTATSQILSRSTFSKLKVVRAGTRVMPATGRNLGAREASGEILLFIDSDTCPAEDYLEKLSGAFQTGVRAGGGAVCVPAHQNALVVPFLTYFLQCNEFMDVGRERRKGFVLGCNVFCERALFLKSGGFPESRAAEDVLFGMAVNRLTPLRFLPHLRAFHIFREDWGSCMRNQALIGEYVVRYRRGLSPKNPLFARYLALLFLPVVLAVKAARITVRVLLSKPSYAFKYLLLLPLVIWGLFSWASGYMKGAVSQDVSV